MSIVAYEILGQDADVRMFRTNDTLKICRKCMRRLEFEVHNPKFVLKRTRFDVYATLDGQTIVSDRFREFVLSKRYPSVKCLPFDNDPVHFQLSVSRKVPFDAIRYGTRFEKYCPECKRYGCVIGATPPLLKVKEPLVEGIFRTDLLFACGDEKSPLLIVGTDTKNEMERFGLKLVFDVVEGI